MDKFKIALVQIKSEFNKDENLKKIDSFAHKAAAMGARIVCFPEMSVCGYDRNFSNYTAENINSCTSSKLLEVSRKNNIVIIAGILEIENDNKYITQVVAFPDHRIEKYQKTHLGKNEKKFCSAGDKIPVFKMRYSKDTDEEVIFGIEICYDMHFPELTAIMSLQGAQIIFAPFASPMDAQKRFNLWEKFIPARAYDNRVYVAACNYKGIGIWNPFGNLEASYKKDDECILFAELDLKSLNDIRQGKTGQMKNQFCLKDRRNELYKKYI